MTTRALEGLDVLFRGLFRGLKDALGFDLQEFFEFPDKLRDGDS